MATPFPEWSLFLLVLCKVIRSRTDRMDSQQYSFSFCLHFLLLSYPSQILFFIARYIYKYIKHNYKYIKLNFCFSEVFPYYFSQFLPVFYREHKWKPEKHSPISALFYSPFCHRVPMEHKNKLSNMTLLINEAPFRAPIQCLGPPLCIRIWILMCVWGTAFINSLSLLPSLPFTFVPCISCNVNFLYVN